MASFTIRRALRRALAATLATLASALWITSAASAGTWTLISCAQPGGQPAPIEGWSAAAVGSPGNFSGAYSTCSQPGGALVAESSNQWPQLRSSGYVWHFTAPAGSTIAGGSMRMELYAPQGQAYLATPNNLHDGADVFANCQFNIQCQAGGPFGGPFAATVAIAHPGGQNIYAEAQCIGPGQPGTSTQDCAQGDGAGGVNAQAAVSAASIELANSTTPTASGFAGGLLAGGSIKGTQDLLFSASDAAGPGVYQVSVQVDAQTVYAATPDSNGGKCQSIGLDPSGYREFLYQQPCKQTESVDVPVDTSRLAEGSHTLKASVTDAAANTSVVYDATIATNNPPANTSPPALIDTSRQSGPPQTGDILQIQPGTWSPASTFTYSWQACSPDGSNCHTLPGQTAARYTVSSGDAGQILVGELAASDGYGTARMPAGSSAPVAGTTSSSSGTGSGAGSVSVNVNLSNPVSVHIANGTPCTGPHLSVAVNGKHGPLTVRYPRGVRITGRLACQATSIPGAIVIIAAGDLTASVKTDADGTFTYLLPPGPARQLTLSYTAYSDDPAPAALAHVLVQVIPRLTFTETPRRTHNGATMHWRGTISGGPYPPRGVTLLAQVRQGRSWHTFAELLARKGRFSYHYRFTRTRRPTVYKFRVALPRSGSGGYGYLPTASRTITVRVA